MRLACLPSQAEQTGVEHGAVFRLIRNDRGVTAIEYTLIAALIGSGIAALLSTIGGEVIAPFNTITSSL